MIIHQEELHIQCDNSVGLLSTYYILLKRKLPLNQNGFYTLALKCNPRLLWGWTQKKFQPQNNIFQFLNMLLWYLQYNTLEI